MAGIIPQYLAGLEEDSIPITPNQLLIRGALLSTETPRSIAERADGETIYSILSRSLRVDWSEYVALVAKLKSNGFFPILVGVILSQNTSDRNSIKAFESLRVKIGIGINDILRARLEDIEISVKKAGLWKQKAATIKRAAEEISRAGGEEYLTSEDPARLREFLLSIKGIGFKTADVFLSVARGAPFFAVDTHAMRIALRWGLVKRRSYGEASRALLELFGPQRAEESHRLLIALGRRYCRARNPACSICPVKDLCPSSSKYLGES